MDRRTLLGMGGAAAAGATLPELPSLGSAGSPDGPAWTHAWTAMPQLTEPHNLPPAPFTGAGAVLVDATLRQTVRVTLTGRRWRVRLSNTFGGAVLPITAASVALPAGGRAGVSGIEAGSVRPLTFSGRTSVRVPAGAHVVSDPVTLDLAAGANLAISLYLATGLASLNLCSHPGSRTTSHLLAGNHHADTDLPGATPTDHWYLLSGVETRTAGDGLAILGDSLTDGRGSTTNGNDRWPDRLLTRLQADRRTRRVAVLNQAAGGNRVLADGLGPNALSRLDRDVLALSRPRWLLIFEGVNDIGTAAATAAAQQQVGDDLVMAYDQMVTRAHARGLRVYGATITPFGGNTGYDDPDGLREATRQRVNRWIRRSGRFDAVVDFDAAARDPLVPRHLAAAYDTGDHLHLNPAGYAALAGAVSISLFV